MISHWTRIWGRHKYLLLTGAIFLQHIHTVWKNPTLEICRKHFKVISSFHCTRCSVLAVHCLDFLFSSWNKNKVIKMKGQGFFFFWNFSSIDTFCSSSRWIIFLLHESTLIRCLEVQISESIYSTSHSVALLRIPFYQWQNVLSKERTNS